MKRRAPPSPEAREMALDRALDGLGAPAIPAGLVARIVRDVPRQPQLPSLEITAVAARAESPAPVAVQPLRAASGHPMRRTRGWLVVGATGFAALAAGIAAVVMVGPAASVPGAPVTQPAPVAGPAPAAVDIPLAATLPADSAAPAALPSGHAAAAARLAAGPKSSGVPARAGSPRPAQVDPEAPGVAPAPEEPVQAFAVAAPTTGPEPANEDVIGPPVPGSRGIMGPTLQQGYGYAGSASGIPSGAPVTMSGGPGGGPGRAPRRF